MRKAPFFVGHAMRPVVCVRHAKGAFFRWARYEKGAFSVWTHAVTRPAPYRLQHHTICRAVQLAVCHCKLCETVCPCQLRETVCPCKLREAVYSAKEIAVSRKVEMR